MWILWALAASGLIFGLTGIAIAARSMRHTRELVNGVRGVLPADQDDVVSALMVTADQLAVTQARIDALTDELAQTRRDLASSIRHVAVVRYDAFGDVGGRLSFSVAMVDDAGDGLVLTSVAARAESRTFAKGLQAGTSEAPLSEEEQQAVSAALTGLTQPVG